MLITKKCKNCRSLGQKLLWNERCMSGRCALDRRRSRPGMHGAKPKVLSQYAKELKEKQKIKLFYLLKEKQLRSLVKKALKAKEPAPNVLVRLLERGLVNVVWSSGYLASKTTARQAIAHGHFLVSGKRVKSPHYLVAAGDIIEIREQSKKSVLFKGLNERLKRYTPPAWLRFDEKTLKTEVVRLPELEEINLPFDLVLVIDFYSRH